MMINDELHLLVVKNTNMIFACVNEQFLVRSENWERKCDFGVFEFIIGFYTKNGVGITPSYNLE